MCVKLRIYFDDLWQIFSYPLQHQQGIQVLVLQFIKRLCTQTVAAVDKVIEKNHTVLGSSQ